MGVIALASVIRSSIRRDVPHKSGAWLHIIGVALIVAALFPYISATDDIVRTEDLATHHGQNHSGKKTPNDNLIRLYEALDSPIVSPACAFVMTFFAIGLVFLPTVKRAYRVAPACAGRSPPFVPGF